jgi:uncharacterized protein YbaR (Trm112 family)
MNEIASNKLDAGLLKILVCPVSHAKLIQVEEFLISTDSETRRRYAIVEGIPNMMVENSEVLSVEEWKRLSNK